MSILPAIIDSKSSDVVTPLYRQLPPFYDVHSFRFTMEFLEIAAVRRVAVTCKLWHRALEEPCVWKRMSEVQGIPLVAGKNRDYKADLKMLCPITISGWQISQTLGRPVGKTPAIDEKWFLMLSRPDFFEPKKLMKETFRFVCTYSHVTRILDKETPLKLDKLGTLQAPQLSLSKRIASSVRSFFGTTASSASERKPQATKMALSLKNQRTLSLYPLKGQECMPVFNTDSSDAVFDQCDTCAPRNGVIFMRTNVVEISKNQPFIKQLALVKELGIHIGSPEFGITPLEVRTLDSVVSVLYKGTCSDDRSIYVRAPNTVCIDNYEYQTVSGGFVFEIGLYVHRNMIDDYLIGVAPSAPAEAYTQNS